MSAELRIVGKTGVMWKGVLFSSRELLAHVGKKVLIDDLDVQDTDEIMVKTPGGGKLLCLVERADRRPMPFQPQKAGKFERALRKHLCSRQSA